MPYDPGLVEPMRKELTEIGVQELQTSGDVEAFMEGNSGTSLVIVNSVCGCAAGMARPGIKLALQHENRPDHVATVFAGQDLEAVAKARTYFTNVPPSSPSFALFKNGELVHFVPRHQIEGKDAKTVALNLMNSFDEYCATGKTA